MNDTLLKVEGVSKRFCRSLKQSLRYGTQDLYNEIVGRNHGGNGQLRADEFWALKDVNFELKRGECLGLIGRNGAGKTTLLRLLNGLIKPDSGRIEIRGRVGALIALGAGFNPILTGRENIYVNAAVLGLSHRDIVRKLDDIIDFAEIGNFIDTPVQSYSSGMQVRLGFSVASALEPDVLLLDEVLAVGDAGFKSKCFNRIGKLLEQCAVVFVTHSMHQLYRIADSVMVLDKGHRIGTFSPHDAIKHYDSLCAGEASASAVFLDNSIADATMTIPESVHAGKEISAQISIVPRRPVVIGQVIFNLTDMRTGTLVAEYRRTELEISIDTNFAHAIPIALGPIFLRGGQYSVSCAVYDRKGKINLAHFANFATLEIENPVPTEAVCGF
jgi:lipopolysaccharide transport system ATP-binding protein